jgi:hypothetical protein
VRKILTAHEEDDAALVLVEHVRGAVEVVGGTARDEIAAGAADQQLVAAAAIDRIVTRLAVESVFARRDDQDVVGRAAVDDCHRVRPRTPHGPLMQARRDWTDL